jgi:hypothetical protein
MTKGRVATFAVAILASVGVALGILYAEEIIKFSGNAQADLATPSDTVVLQIRDLKTQRDLDGLLTYGDQISVQVRGSGILTFVSAEGSELGRGAVVVRVYRSSTDREMLLADQQVASAAAAVAQAELALENLTAAARPEQIASSDASLAQAELTFSNMTSPPTPERDASVKAAHAQAESALVTTEGRVDTYHAALTITRERYCELVRGSGWQYSEAAGWVYQEARTSICPSDGVTMLLDTVPVLLQKLSDDDDDIVSASNALVAAFHNHRGAIAALEAAEASLKSANASLEAYDDAPSKEELNQATKALASARAHRAALDVPPTTKQIAQVFASLQNARASLRTAIAGRKDLRNGPSAIVLLFGEVPAWRNFTHDMSPGTDVKQLKQNLVALGYANYDQMEINKTFDKQAATALKRMQTQLGLEASGQVRFGDIVFLPGISLVEYADNFPRIGATVAAGNVSISLVPSVQIATRFGADGRISLDRKSLHQVKSAIDVSDQDLIQVGSTVEIELPDETVVGGTVREIAAVAVVPQGNQDPYLEVIVAPENTSDLARWTGAAVTVSFVSELAEDVLTAPVASLIALLGGGYAVEVMEQDSRRLLPVELGMYSDGLVEIAGTGLEAGMIVFVPK